MTTLLSSGSRGNKLFIGPASSKAISEVMLLCQHEVKHPPVQSAVHFQDLKIKLVIKTRTCRPPSFRYMAIKVLAGSEQMMTGTSFPLPVA